MSPELMSISRKGPLWLSLLLFFATTPAIADNAAAIIEKTGAFYADQSSLSASVNVELEFPPQFGQGGEMPPITFQYFFHSPNRLALIPPPGDMNAPVIQDGQRYYSEMPMMGTAIHRDAFDLEAFLTEEGKSYLQLPGADILIGLGLGSKTNGSLRSLTGVQLSGSEMIDEIDCYHLNVESEAFHGEFWVAKGDQPWILRVRQSAPEFEPDESGMMMIQPGLDIRISHWNDSPDFGNVFTIKPNKDLKTRETMPTMEEIRAQMGQGGGPRPDLGGPHPSEGKPAPEVTLNTMDGEDIRLPDLKGKVVVLDFWATWCKPCVMGLPLVTKVTDELADQGVVFYAVNQLETETQVKSFLEEKGMEFAVVLDKDGAAGKAFGVKGIPHSVIIDKKGVVRKVHVGFGPGMDEMLKEEILQLLAE